MDQSEINGLAGLSAREAQNAYNKASKGLFHLFKEVDSVGVEHYEKRENVWIPYFQETEEEVDVKSLLVVPMYEGGFKVFGQKVGRILSFRRDLMLLVKPMSVVRDKSSRLGIMCYQYLKGEVFKALESKDCVSSFPHFVYWVWVQRPDVSVDRRDSLVYVAEDYQRNDVLFRVKMSCFFGWQRFPPEGDTVEDTKQ